MATLHIASKEDKERSQRMKALIDAGIWPTPPTTAQERNTCAQCGKCTLLTVPTHGGRICTDCEAS